MERPAFSGRSVSRRASAPAIQNNLFRLSPMRDDIVVEMKMHLQKRLNQIAAKLPDDRPDVLRDVEHVLNKALSKAINPKRAPRAKPASGQAATRRKLQKMLDES